MFHVFCGQEEGGLRSRRWVKEIKRQIKKAGGVNSVSCEARFNINSQLQTRISRNPHVPFALFYFQKFIESSF